MSPLGTTIISLVVVLIVLAIIYFILRNRVTLFKRRVGVKIHRDLKNHPLVDEGLTELAGMISNLETITDAVRSSKAPDLVDTVNSMNGPIIDFAKFIAKSLKKFQPVYQSFRSAIAKVSQGVQDAKANGGLSMMEKQAVAKTHDELQQLFNEFYEKHLVPVGARVQDLFNTITGLGENPIASAGQKIHFAIQHLQSELPALVSKAKRMFNIAHHKLGGRSGGDAKEGLYGGAMGAWNDFPGQYPGDAYTTWIRKLKPQVKLSDRKYMSGKSRKEGFQNTDQIIQADLLNRWAMDGKNAWEDREQRNYVDFARDLVIEKTVFANHDKFIKDADKFTSTAGTGGAWDRQIEGTFIVQPWGIRQVVPAPVAMDHPTQVPSMDLSVYMGGPTMIGPPSSSKWYNRANGTCGVCNTCKQPRGQCSSDCTCPACSSAA